MIKTRSQEEVAYYVVMIGSLYLYKSAVLFTDKLKDARSYMTRKAAVNWVKVNKERFPNATIHSVMKEQV